MFGARPQAAILRQSSMLAPSVPMSIAFFAGPGRVAMINSLRNETLIDLFRQPTHSVARLFETPALKRTDSHHM